ncbi:hypothetical protein D3C81_1072820 [compost metagenome]
MQYAAARDRIHMQRVITGTAIQRVAATTAIQCIVAFGAIQNVAPLTAIKCVVASTTEHVVIAGPSHQHVVPVGAPRRNAQCDQACVRQHRAVGELEPFDACAPVLVTIAESPVLNPQGVATTANFQHEIVALHSRHDICRGDACTEAHGVVVGRGQGGVRCVLQDGVLAIAQVEQVGIGVVAACHHIITRATVQDVVARIGSHAQCVVACTTVQAVKAVAAVQYVIALSSSQQVITVAAGQLIIASHT